MFSNELDKSTVSKDRIKKKNVTGNVKQSREAVLWGIDSSEDDIWHFRKVRDILQMWTGSDDKIIPLSVLSPADFEPDMWPRKGLEEFRQELKNEMKEKIGDFLDQLSFPKEKMKVLFTERESLSALVEKFLGYASRENAELIALLSGSSHKSRVMGLGSFSEQAIATSQIPVMILTDETQVPSNLKRFLFPTDFSSVRKIAFKETLRWAKRYDAEIVLYHQVGTSVTPAMMASVGAPMDAVWVEGAWNAEQERVLKLVDEWKEEAQLENVPIRIEREVNIGGWSERVSEVAQIQDASVIVIPVRRGRWQQMLFGGKIRKVLSTATCPVIFYPDRSAAQEPSNSKIIF